MDDKFIKLGADGTDGGAGGQGSTDTSNPNPNGEGDKVNPMETLVKTITVLADKVTAMDAVLAKLTSGKTEEPKEPKATEDKKPLKNDKGEIDLDVLTETIAKKVLEATGKVIDTKFSQISASSFKSSLSQEDLDYLKDIPGVEDLPIETQQAILKKRVKKEEAVVGKKSPNLPTIGSNGSGKTTNSYEEANKKRKGIK